MTQLTDRSAPLSSASAVERGRAAALTVSFLRGAIAACLGLGLFAVLVLAMWIISPYPDTGAGKALRVAAALWLLTHGIELVRADTLSGNPAPLGVIPLLLMALPVWLVYRTARDALEPDEGPPRLSASAVVFTLTCGYLLVGAVSVLCATGAPLSAHPLRAVLTLPVVAALSATAGAWTASGGRPRGLLPSWLPGAPRRALVRAVGAPAVRRGAAVALRAGVASVLLLLGGGALLVGISLAWHGGSAHLSFVRLASDWSGRFAVLLLGVVLVPNAAMWGAAYGLGPGFALGTGATATPFGVTGDYSLPSFPLLAAVPEGPGSALTWAAAAVPVLAGGTLAWFTVRAAAPPYAEKEEAWGVGATALTAALGAVVCAVLTAFLAAMSGGPMGNGRLAVLGPVWWLTGAAALMWTVGLGVPTALVLRAWRLRERRGGDVPPPPEPAAGAGAGAGAADAIGRADADAKAAEPGGRAAAWWPAPWRRLMWLLSGRAVPETPVPEPPSEAVGGPGVPARDPDARADAQGRSGARARTRARTRARPRSDARVRGARAVPVAPRAEVGVPGFEPYDFLVDEAWHERGARKTRWAAIKAASGGPTADFPPTGTPPGPPYAKPPGPPYAKKSDFKRSDSRKAGFRRTGFRKGGRGKSGPGPDGSVPDSGPAPGLGPGFTP
ncbi:cell division protein PerM [Streptomyces sp. NPDC055025]